MRLLKLRLQNYRSYADSGVLEFPSEGLIALLGSTGSGKSNIIEAIKYAFYGASVLRGTKPSIRWNHAAPKQTASVTLWFELGIQYRIERGESNAKLINEATQAVLVEGTDALNKYAPDLLGMTASEFQASFLVGQKDLAHIGNMLPGERLSFVRKMMGHERIDVGLKSCRKRKAELADERRGLEAGLGAREPLDEAVTTATGTCANAEAHRTDCHARTAVASGAFDAAHDALAASTNHKAEHGRLTHEAENAKLATTAAGLEITRLEEKAAQISAAHLTLADGEAEVTRLVPLRAQRDELLAAKGAAGERATLVKRSASLADEMDLLNTQMRNAEARVAAFYPLALEAARSALKVSHHMLTGMQEERARRYAEYMAEAQSANKEAQLQAKRLVAIQDSGADGGCPTCLRALGDAFTEVVKVLRGQQDEAEARAAQARMAASEWDSESDDEMAAGAGRDAASSEVTRIEALSADAAMAKRSMAEKGDARTRAMVDARSINDRLALLPAVTFDQASLSQVEAEIRRLEELDAMLARPRALISQAAETAELLTDRYVMREMAEEKLKESTDELCHLEYDPLQHQGLTDAHLRAQKAHEDARVALARAEEAERGAIERLGSARAALAEYDRKAERLNAVLAEHLLHEKVDARLSEFRVAVASTVRPELEELTSGFVHLLTDGRYDSVAITDDFTMVLHKSGMSMEVVSGGEEDIAALAMRLAISQMITERAGRPMGLLMLDEIFSALDETRRGSVVALLQRLRTVFPQILLTSHVPGTVDAADHAISLEYDEAEGCTRVAAV